MTQPVSQPVGGSPTAARPSRVALVFGGANGINRATARMLSAQGCAVAIADRDLASATQVVADIRATGALAIAVPVEMAEPATVTASAAAVVAAAPAWSC